MLQEKVGVVVGVIWNALNEGGAQNMKELKKTTKENEKDLYLGLD